MDVAAAIAVTLGTTALLGAGAFVRWTGPQPLSAAVRATLAAVAAVAAGVVAVGSLLDAYGVLARVARGAVEPALFLEYLTYARHGRAAAVRAALALVLGWWAVRTRGRARDDVAYGAVALALLASIGVASHSGTAAVAGVLADVAHWVATVVWAGTVVLLAWLPVWGERAAVVAAMTRVSLLGGASVAVLATSGLAMAALNLHGPAALVATEYGLALLAKLGLVGLVLQAAVVQRFVLLPRLKRGADATTVRRVLRVESLLLAVVLVAAAFLTTREPARTAPAAVAPRAADVVHAHG